MSTLEVDTDNDGVSDRVDIDDDNDGITDVNEGTLDLEALVKVPLAMLMRNSSVARHLPEANMFKLELIRMERLEPTRAIFPPVMWMLSPMAETTVEG